LSIIELFYVMQMHGKILGELLSDRFGIDIFCRIGKIDNKSRWC